MAKKLIPLSLLIMVMLWTVPALAVLQKTKIVSNGEPVKNTQITIISEDGQEEEKNTDDKGFVIFEGEKGKTYTLKWSGGEKTVSVSGFSTTTLALAGAGVAGATAIAVAASGGGSSGSGSDNDIDNDSHNTDDGSNGSTPTVPDLNQIPGTYSLSGELSNHSIPVSVQGQDVVINSTSTMSGMMDPATGAYTGTGSYGEGNTETFVGTWTITPSGDIYIDGVLTFHYGGGGSESYNVRYTKIS